MSKLKMIDGLPVFDAKRPLRLSITTQDIVGASPKHPQDCAMARAAMRALHVIEARVHLTRTYLRTNNHNWVRYETPGRVRAEIIAYDRGGTFQPLDVRLNPITAGLRKRLAERKRVSYKTPPNKRRPMQKPQIVKDVRSGPA